MKLYLLLVFSLLSQMLLSQEKVEDKVTFDFSLMNSDKKFVDSMPNLQKNIFNYYDLTVTRELDFGINESVFRAKPDYASRVVASKYKMEDMHLLTTNDTVIAIIGELPYKSMSVYVNDSVINQFIKRHNLLYKTKTNIDDLVSDILVEESYGYLCGIAPVAGGVLENNGFYFDDINNITVFRKWLRSYNLELQSYGVDALMYLYDNNPNFIVRDIEKELQSQDVSIISHIKLRNSIINTCSGCSGGIYDRVF